MFQIPVKIIPIFYTYSWYSLTFIYMYLLFKDFFIDQLSVEIILNHLSGNFITCMTNITINNIFKNTKYLRYSIGQ